jgi:hypothetical protein
MNNRPPTGWILMKFYILLTIYIFFFFLENLSTKFKFHKNLTRIKVTLHEGQYTFAILYCTVVLKMRNILDKNCRENKNTNLYSVAFFPKKLLFVE